MLNHIKWPVAIALAFSVSQTYAQHSDVIFDIDAGQIVLEGEPHDHEEEGHAEEEEHAGPVLTQNGKFLYETDFGDFGGGPYLTDDPGFASHEETGVLNSGEVIGFSGVGSLQYWDGFNWSTTTDDVVSVLDIMGETTDFTSSGVNHGSSTFIDAADSSGGFHAHVDFSINSDADIGAYLIEMMLLGLDSTGASTVYASSETFYIAFNNGLTEQAYEASVDALAAVPVPAAAWLFGSALIGLAGIGRKKAKG